MSFNFNYNTQFAAMAYQLCIPPLLTCSVGSRFFLDTFWRTTQQGTWMGPRYSSTVVCWPRRIRTRCFSRKPSRPAARQQLCSLNRSYWRQRHPIGDGPDFAVWCPQAIAWGGGRCPGSSRHTQAWSCLPSLRARRWSPWRCSARRYQSDEVQLFNMTFLQ